MGPAATALFFRRLIEATSAKTDQEHLHVVIDSDPSIPDRTKALLEGGPSPAPQLIEMARRLQMMGAELLVMPCNTAHVFANDIARAVDVPLVNWIEQVVDFIAADSEPPAAVGLLATTGTVRAGLYQRSFERAAISTVVPHEPEQRLLMETLYASRGLKAGWPDQPALIEIARRLSDRGAEAFLLACTDLAAAQLDRRLDNIRVYDSVTIVAERTVQLAGAGLEEPAITT
jgi:aspartate racemase